MIPDDPSFNRTVRRLIRGELPEPRLVFINVDDRVAVELHPGQYADELPHMVRQRMEEKGELKGVVHVAALDSAGTITSTVEYLPTHQAWAIRRQSPWIWIDQQELLAELLPITEELFEHWEEVGDQESDSQET